MSIGEFSRRKNKNIETEKHYGFVVFNEENACKYVDADNKKYAVISILSNEEADLSEDDNRIGLLRLKFHDIDAFSYSNLKDHPNIKIFSKKQAIEILNFYDCYKDKVDYFVVHCEAGISRSAGVAAALCYIKCGRDDYYFTSHIPNRYVYRTIINQFEGYA